MNNRKTVFLIVGQTASGKDSLVNAMCKQFKPPEPIFIDGVDADKWHNPTISTPYKQLISYTTRPRRENEGDTHIFISPDEVDKYKDDIVAYTKIGKYEYFATKQQLYDCDFYIIDYLGIQTLKGHKLDDEFRFVTIYINTPYEIRKQRALSNRKDNEEVFNLRNRNEAYQFACMKEWADFDYSINNINFDKALKILKHIVEVENETI
jgi:guanylate kinase